MKRLLSSLFLASSLLSACQLQEPEPLDFETCDDNIDNDGDGFFDCSDDDCTLIDPVCAPDEECNDNIDNDFNGLQDCQDDACAGTPDCMCVGTGLVLANSFPFVFEGDSADGVFAFNVLGCQTGEAREAFVNLDFSVDRVNLLLEPLDDVPMVLQTTEDCGDDEAFSCNRNQDSVGAAPLNVLNFDVSGGATLFFVGAREAGQTGRFRLTFTEAQ
jgi:hypothetical protein